MLLLCRETVGAAAAVVLEGEGKGEGTGVDGQGVGGEAKSMHREGMQRALRRGVSHCEIERPSVCSSLCKSLYLRDATNVCVRVHVYGSMLESLCVRVHSAARFTTTNLSRL